MLQRQNHFDDPSLACRDRLAPPCKTVAWQCLFQRLTHGLTRVQSDQQRKPQHVLRRLPPVLFGPFIGKRLDPSSAGNLLAPVSRSTVNSPSRLW
ncbi:hypothetical protein ACOJBM_06530 [Rhizobium beringeri]